MYVKSDCVRQKFTSKERGAGTELSVTEYAIAVARRSFAAGQRNSPEYSTPALGDDQ